MSNNGNKPARKLSLVASKGSLDMAYPPLILANAARMSGIEAHIFFTFWGLDLITKSKFRSLKVSTVGNPSLSFAPYAPNMHMPNILGALPGMTPLATAMMKREIAKLDFPPVDEFIEMILDAGAHLYGCKMSMDMMGLEADDLVDGAEVLGAMEFLEVIEGGQVMFI